MMRTPNEGGGNGDGDGRPPSSAADVAGGGGLLFPAPLIPPPHHHHHRLHHPFAVGPLGMMPPPFSAAGVVVSASETGNIRADVSISVASSSSSSSSAAAAASVKNTNENIRDDDDGGGDGDDDPGLDPASSGVDENGDQGSAGGEEDVEYQCDKENDDQIFMHKSAMQLHAREAHRNDIKPHQCQQCMKSFSSNHQLVQHIRVHTGEKPYKCSYCDRRFKQLSHVQQHTRLHTGERPYKCHMPECGRAFIQLSNLQQHLRNHEAQVERLKNRPFHCNICGKGFATESSLRTHTGKHAALLGGPSAHACPICHKLFFSGESLMEHMKYTHKDPNASGVASKRRSSHHPCPVCGKHYVNEGSLRKHLACHPETAQLTSSLRMYACSVCQAVFPMENGLLTHMEQMRMDPKHQFAAQYMLSRAAAERRERESLLAVANVVAGGAAAAAAAAAAATNGEDPQQAAAAAAAAAVAAAASSSSASPGPHSEGSASNHNNNHKMENPMSDGGLHAAAAAAAAAGLQQAALDGGAGQHHLASSVNGLLPGHIPSSSHLQQMQFHPPSTSTAGIGLFQTGHMSSMGLMASSHQGSLSSPVGSNMLGAGAAGQGQNHQARLAGAGAGGQQTGELAMREALRLVTSQAVAMGGSAQEEVLRFHQALRLSQGDPRVALSSLGMNLALNPAALRPGHHSPYGAQHSSLAAHNMSHAPSLMSQAAPMVQHAQTGQ